MVAEASQGADVGLTDFRGRHAGETVWVLASGSSLDYIPASFWSDKVTVCVNFVGLKLDLQSYYSVTHYHCDAAILAEKRPDLPVITPRVDQGGPAAIPVPPDAPNIHFAPTADQQYAAFDTERHWPTEPDMLVVGPTSLHMTMHFAAYLGAAHIVLAGADCGRVDDRMNFTGYAPGTFPLDVWESSLRQVAGRLRRDGVSVVSVNPFVNFALEGHSFRGPTVSIN